MVRRSAQDRIKVAGLTLEGKGISEIVKITGFPREFVSRWAKRAEERSPIADARRSGRKRKRDATQEAKLLRATAG